MKNVLDSLYERADSAEAEKIRARLRVNVTEHLLITMEDSNVSKAELARRAGVSRSAVTQALTGSRNMTLNAIADYARVLGQEVVVKFKPLQDAKSESTARIASSKAHVAISMGVKQPSYWAGSSQVHLRELSSPNTAMSVARVA